MYNDCSQTKLDDINMHEQSSDQDPLHGITLKIMVTRLEQKYGWQELGQRINIKCFNSNPSIKSSLSFLRKTPWAREKVEALYLQTKWPN